MTTYSIHPDTNLGAVHLIVSNLAYSEKFYTAILGFQSHQEKDNTVILTVDGKTPLVVLKENPRAHPKPAHTTGLYHFAILVPTRYDLGQSLYHLLETKYPLQGASDHLVSEALYLADPDGNGIEIYRDRPRSEWTEDNGQLKMATLPLDAEGILQVYQQNKQDWQGLPPKTCLGHMHLHVSNLAQAEAFYRNVLGFDLMIYYGHSAAFLSAGGYHHHLGINTWAGQGAPPPPADSAGLRYFTINLPNKDELARLIAHLKTNDIQFEEKEEGIFVEDSSNNRVMVSYNNSMKIEQADGVAAAH